MIKSLNRNQRSISERRAPACLSIAIILIYSSAPAHRNREAHRPAVYVCLCNQVTDRELIEAAVDLAYEPPARGAPSLGEEVADRLGAGIGCGTCREFAVALVEREVASRAVGRAA